MNDNKSIWVFTPSRTAPEDLEFILVQRHKLLDDAVERVRESALSDHKHHLLFVGPRGCGKTHLLTLIVNRLGTDEELADRLRIAWLNEDETCTTLLELLFKIHTALEKRYPAEFDAEKLAAAYDMKPEAALDFVSGQLLSALDSRTLLVATENLDAIFEGLGDSGQKQLRSFIQENPKLSIVATAQRLVEDLSNRNSPFFGFFQTEHLKPLNIEQATELLQNIARLQQKSDVVQFLATSRGRSRVRAIHHLSGGNHRIYIVLSQFITRESVDALLEPFMKMVDELTPYYQERIRWLPPMQRKIVEYLCVCEGTVPVKQIAKRLFATPQTISSQLQDLREKGYVEANQRGRESLYEISEPLMRICVEVKDNQRLQPLRLLVDFLRVWYDDHDLKNRLGQMHPDSAACAYLSSAIQRNAVEGNLRQHILLEEFAASFSEMISIKEREELVSDAERLPETVMLAMHCWAEGKTPEAHACIEESLHAASSPAEKDLLLLQVCQLLMKQGFAHNTAGDYQRAIANFTAVVDLPSTPVRQVAWALLVRGLTYGQTGDLQSAIADFSTLISLPGVSADQIAIALLNRGLTHGRTGNSQNEISDYTSVIDLPGAPAEQVAMALFNRGLTHRDAGDQDDAILDYTSLINLAGVPPDQIAEAYINRGVTLARVGDLRRAIDDYTAVLDLFGAPAEQLIKAYFNRGLARSQAGELTLAIADLTAVIESAKASVTQVSKALYLRGIINFQERQKNNARADLEAVIGLPGVQLEFVIDAQCALAELHCHEGRWNEGFRVLERGLETGTKAHPAYRSPATDLIGVIFTAGLSPEGRREKVAELLRIYSQHHALPVLGEAVVQHIGQVFRGGAPFPSADNLEGWASVWEQAAESVPDFRLSVRLLRTGVEFVKGGGDDPSILLTLTAPERSILHQALGLASEDT